MKSLLLLLFFCFYSLSEARIITVKIEAMKFDPKVVEASVGDIIKWDNLDFFPHTATALDKIFNSGPIASMQSWSYKIIKNGTFKYQCSLHQSMNGSVIVR